MNYEIKGKENKTLLLFINGGGLSKWMWKYQKPIWNEYKCIFFDLPGHGDNSDIEFNTIDDVCLLLIDLIKKESENHKAIIIGLSIGAQIVLNLLKSYNDYISKAVVISGLNNPMKGYSFLVKPMLVFSMPLVKRRWFSKIQFNQFSLPINWFEDYYKDSLKISKKTLMNMTKENMAFNFDKAVHKIPVMILTGEREKEVVKKSAEKTANYIKDSKYYIVKGAGHGIPYEKPEIFNKLLLKFISDSIIEDFQGNIVKQG
ncbi:MAG: alpha/beta hydrolase [Firmicutes bacterium]|nr:alpha/beta hydrolase [Bacillota bacterium]